MKVVLGLFPSGCLRSFSAEGHADHGGRGNDPVCAAVSVLLRTACHALYREQGIICEGDIPDEGRAALTVRSYDQSVQAKLAGMTCFLLTGLCDVAAEHPDHISIQFEDEHMEE